MIEFVTFTQWESQARRVEKANLKERGMSQSFSGIARRANDHIIEIQSDNCGMLVKKGWREAMKEEVQ